MLQKSTNIKIQHKQKEDIGIMKNYCRLCGQDKMTKFLDLGYAPPADQFLKKEQLSEPETHYPLVVVRCDHCMFVQLNYVVPPEILYQHDYPYESSVTKTGRMHFDAFAKSVIKEFNVLPTDLVIDIGSNVGVLLNGFKQRGIRVLGIDPAENIADIANKNGIPTLVDFFHTGIANKVLKKYTRAKIITCTNVFAHIDDLIGFMEEVDKLLMPDGILIVEAPYLAHLIHNLEYDTIYHEHLSYLSITPLVSFFKKCGFELFKVEQMKIHGGSNRVFIARAGEKNVKASVEVLLKAENEESLHSMVTLNKFAQDVAINRSKLVSILCDLKSQGKNIAAVSAPAKGMTLLTYCKIGNNFINFITEKSELKIGSYTPGMHLQVKPDSALIDEHIDYALLLAWNFKDEIMQNLSQFKSRGGRFIIPIPEPIII